MANKNTPVIFHSRVVINKRTKTYTHFWQEDWVNTSFETGRGNGAVVSKIRSETHTYDTRENPYALSNLLSLIGFACGRKYRGYSYTVN